MWAVALEIVWPATFSTPTRGSETSPSGDTMISSRETSGRPRTMKAKRSPGPSA